MFKNLKISTKIIGSFLLLIIFSVGFTSYVEYRLASKAAKNQILNDFAFAADIMEGYVLEFLNGTKNRVVDFSSDGFIRDSAKRIVAGEKNVIDDLSRHLTINKKSLDSSIFGISVVSRDGIVIGSTNDDEIGLDYSTSDHFLEVKNLRYGEAHFGDVNMQHAHFGISEPHLMVSASLFDKENKKSLGIIINHLKLDSLNDVLYGRRQLELGAMDEIKGRRKTLEVYMVDKNKIMITQSRFIDNAVLKQKVDTLPVINCDTKKETSGIYPDYRGVSVVGVSVCLQNGWVLLVEIDEEEAFSTLIDFRKNVFYMTLILLLMSLIYALYLSRGIISPIKILLNGVKMISKGDLAYKVKVVSKDEIGQLAESFNEMTEKMKKSHEKINQEKEKFETLLMSIGDGVFGIDKEQKIVYFNKQAEKISGYKSSSVLGKYYYDILKFVKVKDKTENIEFIRKALSGKASDMGNHTVLIRKDKSEVPVADSATPIKDKKGNILGAIVVFRDASKERELDRAKSELVSFAGHQLKAPLTYLAGNVEMLKERKLDVESSKLADEIALGVNEMKKLVSDVLNISRIEQGDIELKPEPTQLEEVVDEILKESAVLTEKRNIKIEFTNPSTPLSDIMLDPKYIHEVFKNIISNAIKYTKDTITISLDRKGDDIIFKCADNGIGIPKSEQSKIFTKFYTASNTSKIETKGTGLGLSIAKVLIEKMNGRIWFESEENKGSTFYISLPLL